jgi:hypothetical protein
MPLNSSVDDNECFGPSFLYERDYPDYPKVKKAARATVRRILQ